MHHRNKLRWARHHIEVLNDAVVRFEKGKPYSTSLEVDAEAGKCRSRYTQTHTPPIDDWSLIVGDIIHNLRSALDHLAFAIFCKKVGPAVAEEFKKQIQFPIFDTPSEWNDRWQRQPKALRLPSIHDALKAHQPFSTPVAPSIHALSMLRDLSNLDKHRNILVTVSQDRARGYVQRKGEFPVGLVIRHGPYYSGDIVAEWPDRGPASHYDVGGNIRIHPQLSFDSLGPGHGRPIFEWIGLVIIPHVENSVFPPLEDFLNQ